MMTMNVDSLLLEPDLFHSVQFNGVDFNFPMTRKKGFFADMEFLILL